MEKIIYLNEGSGSNWDKLNEMLSDGWKIVQIKTSKGGCFVWIKKVNEIAG